MIHGPFSVDSKIALIAGGAGGIGHVLARGLARFGATVIIADIDTERTNEISEALADEGYKARAIAVDITEARSIKDMVSTVVSEFNRLDVFVNTVGQNVFMDSLELPEDDWEQVLRLNLTGAFLASREAAKVMVASETGGSIINFASVTALRGSPGQAAYAAAKAALVNLTKSMALEWIKHDIRVNGISPVMTETPINTEWLNAVPDRKESIARRIPIGRLGVPDDYVGPVIFLASEASRFMIGQTLFIDGGASVTHPLFGG